jgi:peptidoglycan/LPS O-acetylase OafA/YrhL
MDTFTKPRLYFIDNLRWLMIIFVVLMHVNVTYGMIGGWYYIEKTKLDLFQTIYFGMYGSFTQAYFMGLLFFIAGYFVPSSFDRKGFKMFTKERCIRLGIPTITYMLLIHPLTITILNHYQNWNLNIPVEYVKYIRTFSFIGSSGPLWFAFALLIFSILYATIRKLGSHNTQPALYTATTKQIFGVALLISVFTFVTRIVFPIGTNILNMQLCFFPQYIVLFVLGIVFFRRNLLQTIPYRLGINWFKYTLFIGVPFWFLIMIFGKDPANSIQPFTGHFTWQSAAYSFWESFSCVGICLGLIVMFREKFNRMGRWSKFLSDNAFGVYVFHTPILVFISMLFKDISMYPFFKYLIVALITLPLCFLISHFIRKIPGVDYVIK